MKVALLAAVIANCPGYGYKFEEDTHWTDDTAYPDVGQGKIIITNSGDDTLTWLDLQTLEPVFEEGVGRLPPEREGPHHGAVAPGNSAYYVGLSNYVPGSGSGPHGSHGTGAVEGYLLKYDMQTHVRVGERRVDRSPGDVRITPDGRWILQSHFDVLKIQEVLEEGGPIEDMYSRLAIIDAATMETVAMVPVCPAAHGLGISPSGNEAYVTCWASDELAVVTLTAPFAVERFAVGPGVVNPAMPSYEPYAATVSPTDGKVWVSCLRTGDLRVWDPATRAFEATPVVTGGAPFFGDFTAAGDTLYVPHQGDNALAAVTVADRTVAQIALPISACEAPHAALVLPGDQRLVVVCEGDHVAPGSVAIVNLTAGAVEAVHEVGVFPDDAVLVLP